MLCTAWSRRCVSALSVTTVEVMRKKTPIPTTLLRLAASQSDVLRRAQVLAHGMGRHTIARLLRDEQWYLLADGIYSRSPTPDWTALAWTGALLAGKDAALGAEAAMYLHGVGSPPETIAVWSGSRQVRDRSPWQFKEGIRASRGSPPRVSLEDATLEVCAEAELDRIVAALSAATASCRTTTQRIRRRTEQLRNLRHRRDVLEVLTEVDNGMESPLELRYAKDVERAHSLPCGVRQLSVSKGTRSDVTYLEFGVLVEIDGRLGHSGDGAFKDAARDNRHAVAGFVTLRFGWNDVTRSPCAAAPQAAAVMRARGWQGRIRICRRCKVSSEADVT